jgi:hypothetical protein
MIRFLYTSTFWTSKMMQTKQDNLSLSENNMESLVRKLQSLQNKTTANGCTEQEALHAAQKVAELLDKYGLSVEQLKLDTAKDECNTGAFDLGSKRRPHLVAMCMSAIAKYTSTKTWYKVGGPSIEYTFFGFPTDVKIAGWVLKTFKEAMDTAYRVYFPTYTGTLHWKTVRKAFMDGMSDRLNNRLAELTEKRSKPPVVEVRAEVDAPPSHELMILKERNVEKAFASLKLKIRHSYRRRSNDDSAGAYLAGAEAGDRVALHAGELQ